MTLCIAFGYGGIYDQDEAERIVEEKVITGEVIRYEPKELPPYPAEQMVKNLPAWTEMMHAGKKAAAQIIAMVSSKYTLSPSQVAAIRDAGVVVEQAPEVDPFVAEMESAEREMAE